MRNFRVLAAIGAVTALLALSLPAPQVESEGAQMPPEYAPLSWSSSTNDHGNGTRTTKVTTGWQNYFDEHEWKRIDTKPKDVGNGWVVNETPYRLTIPDFADEPVTFTSTTAFDADTRSFRGDAHISKTKRFTGVSHVQGEYEGEVIVYRDAHPLGDIMYKPKNDGFQALVRLNAIPASCVGQPNDVVTVPFTEEYSNSLIPKNGGSNISGTQRNIGNGWRADSGEGRKIVTKQARVWDITGKSQDIVVNGRVVSGRLVASKVLPCSFLLSANYPVFTDTTTTVQSSTTDGQVEHTAGSAWATVRGATQGTAARTDQTTEAFLAWTGGSGDYYNIIIFLIFDTSALPDTDTITAATLSVYYPGATTSAMTMYAVKNRQSSDTLAITHYDEIGDSGPGTGDNYGSYSRGAGEAAGTETITLSAAGIANISKTSTLTYFALVDSDHWDNSTPTKTNTAGATIAMSERSGTSEDPTLEITHSAAAGAASSFVLF